MTESVIGGLGVFGVVVLIGKKLFGCADGGKMDAHLGKARVEPVGDEGIGDVFAIPCQKKIHPVNTRGGKMRCVANGELRQNAVNDQLGGESVHFLVQVEQRHVGQKLQAFRCLGGIADTGLVEYQLRREEVKLVPLAIPPLAGEFLSRELQQIAGRPRDIEARNGGLDENRMWHFGVLPRLREFRKREWPDEPAKSVPRSSRSCVSIT